MFGTTYIPISCVRLQRSIEKWMASSADWRTHTRNSTANNESISFFSCLLLGISGSLRCLC